MSVIYNDDKIHYRMQEIVPNDIISKKKFRESHVPETLYLFEACTTAHHLASGMYFNTSQFLKLSLPLFEHRFTPLIVGTLLGL